ncbi:MAG: hypothetical protein ABW321_18295, partial [Polyangiales bacterium]
QTCALPISLSAELHRVALPTGAIGSYERRNGHDEALILTMAERGTSVADASPSRLTRITEDGAAVEYVLGTTSFDALAQSSDGRYAVAFRKNSSTRTLDNPN